MKSGLCISITIMIAVMMPLNNSTCDNFMSVLLTRTLWSKSNESCAPTFFELDDQIRIFSAQMTELNSTLTIFTNYDLRNSCAFDYPNIFLSSFDAIDLLLENGFGGELQIMKSWGDTGYTRVSDIFRLLLAQKHRKTYIDFDIHFLNTTRTLYMNQFVGAAMWNDNKCAIEITNSAFCLNNNVLNDLITYLKQRIITNNNYYFYTELGPSMFHKVIMNNHPILLYSQNHPQLHSIDDIVASMNLYHHHFLHLTGRIRSKSEELSYQNLIFRIRDTVGLSPVSHLPPSKKISLYEYYESLFQNLKLYPDDLNGWVAVGEHMRNEYVTVATGISNHKYI